MKVDKKEIEKTLKTMYLEGIMDDAGNIIDYDKFKERYGEFKQNLMASLYTDLYQQTPVVNFDYAEIEKRVFAMEQSYLTAPNTNNKSWWNLWEMACMKKDIMFTDGDYAWFTPAYDIVINNSIDTELIRDDVLAYVENEVYILKNGSDSFIYLSEAFSPKEVKSVYELHSKRELLI